MDKKSTVMVILMVVVFVLGMCVIAYPVVNGFLTDFEIQREAQSFLSWADSNKSLLDRLNQENAGDAIPEETEPEHQVELWRNMKSYNEEIFIAAQAGLDSKSAYERPAFVLTDYGLESEIFAAIEIPKLELKMPIYLGATYRHMADGAALLTQTSIPIGGQNTNAVIAGHRGWGGASYFKELDKLEIGDQIQITNLWQDLYYEVAEIRIIDPNEVEEILIQAGRDLVTLLTCHPYASGGRQRYLVICERVR